MDEVVLSWRINWEWRAEKGMREGIWGDIFKIKGHLFKIKGHLRNAIES